jgi:hypothetical protein
VGGSSQPYPRLNPTSSALMAMSGLRRALAVCKCSDGIAMTTSDFSLKGPALLRTSIICLIEARVPLHFQFPTIRAFLDDVKGDRMLSSVTVPRSVIVMPSMGLCSVIVMPFMGLCSVIVMPFMGLCSVIVIHSAVLRSVIVLRADIVVSPSGTICG